MNITVWNFENWICQFCSKYSNFYSNSKKDLWLQTLTLSEKNLSWFLVEPCSSRFSVGSSDFTENPTLSMDKQSYTFNWASGSETQYIAAKLYYTVYKVVYDSGLLQLRSKKSTAVVGFFSNFGSLSNSASDWIRRHDDFS